MRPGAVEEAEQPIGDKSAEELRRLRSSPLVRNIAKEHGIDIARLEGTGMSGRVTRNDIMSFIESGAALTPQQAMQPQAKAPTAPSMPSIPMPAPVQPPPAPVQPMTGDRVEQMSVMRKKIAEHMTLSRRTSAHVTTVYEIDMTRVVKLRDQYKDAFYQNVGTKLSYMPFIFQAVTSAIRQFPIFNSQVSGDQIIYKRDINLGMAVALDWGLIVPVIKRADELSIAGLARAANDLADRARTKQLKPDDVAGGTFTITNPGVFGGLFGTPIINQPQVAILGVGAIVKRPKVVTSEEGDDYIAIRHMAYFALTFDHRIVDGSDAEKFLGYVKQILEAGQFVIQ
jgi:2-oxoglutarate dehydrogenase E2 component (dihydrolipoamide succinyltransferase)